jgi:hypothetical protein
MSNLTYDDNVSLSFGSHKPISNMRIHTYGLKFGNYLQSESSDMLKFGNFPPTPVAKTLFNTPISPIPHITFGDFGINSYETPTEQKLNDKIMVSSIQKKYLDTETSYRLNELMLSLQKEHPKIKELVISTKFKENTYMTSVNLYE